MLISLVDFHPLAEVTRVQESFPQEFAAWSALNGLYADVKAGP